MSSEPQKVQTGSHCFEPDGSFHVVCMFVIGVSIFCGLISLICTWKVIKMCIQIIRNPDNVGENVKMYKLQPASQLKGDPEFGRSRDDIRRSSPSSSNGTARCSPSSCARLSKVCKCACASRAGSCNHMATRGNSVNNIETVETVFIKQDQEKDFSDSPCIC